MDYNPNDHAAALAGGIVPGTIQPVAIGAGLSANVAAVLKDMKIAAKKRGLNLKSEIFIKCLEILKAFQQSDNYK
jgi:hypothetical protein